MDRLFGRLTTASARFTAPFPPSIQCVHTTASSAPASTAAWRTSSTLPACPCKGVNRHYHRDTESQGVFDVMLQLPSPAWSNSRFSSV